MFEYFMCIIFLIILLNYLSLSLFIFRNLGIFAIIIMTTIFYLFILLSTIIIIEFITTFTNLI